MGWSAAVWLLGLQVLGAPELHLDAPQSIAAPVKRRLAQEGLEIVWTETATSAVAVIQVRERDDDTVSYVVERGAVELDRRRFSSVTAVRTIAVLVAELVAAWSTTFVSPRSDAAPDAAPKTESPDAPGEGAGPRTDSLGDGWPEVRSDTQREPGTELRTEASTEPGSEARTEPGREVRTEPSSVAPPPTPAATAGVTVTATVVARRDVRLWVAPTFTTWRAPFVLRPGIVVGAAWIGEAFAGAVRADVRGLTAVEGENIETRTTGVGLDLEGRWLALRTRELELAALVSAGVSWRHASTQVVDLFVGRATRETTQQWAARLRAGASSVAWLSDRWGLRVAAGVELVAPSFVAEVPPFFAEGRTPLREGWLSGWLEVGVALQL